RLSASDHEDRLRFRIEREDTVIVPAGGAADPITVHVAPKGREARGRPHPHQLEFRGLLLGKEYTANPFLVGQARFTSVAAWQPAWLRWASRWAALLSPAVRGAREHEQPSQASTAALTVSTDGLDMDVQPAEVEGPEATFRITFVNRLHTPIPVRLSASDHEDRLRFRIEREDTVIVPAGGAADPMTVHVAPKGRETMGRPYCHHVEFRGLLLGKEHTANPALVGQARFTSVAAWQPAWLRWASRWAVLLPLLLLLVLAGGRILAHPATRPAVTPPPAPTRAVSSVQPTRPRATVAGVTPSRPSIRLFTLVHRHRGQPYELVWQMSGAAHATLDGRPVAARGSLVLQAPLHSATYSLVAMNGARRATASLHLVVDAHTTDAHAVVLTTPAIATFALRRRKGQLEAFWLVRNAVHVRLQDRLVGSAGVELVPIGPTWLRLVASNDVGSRQRLLLLPRVGPPARPARQRTTAAARRHRLPTARPTAAPRPTATPTPRPTDTPAAPPPATSTPRPTATSTPRPTATSTPRPTATSTPRPTVTPTPRPTVTPTPVSVTIGLTTPPVAVVTLPPTAVPVTCCLAQP
ncbi:MAG TPA: hypothetical protein VJY65_03705, partial [Chloroflexota bacterium]|nr:hypothetical protein [Chloroflexota bacterium]